MVEQFSLPHKVDDGIGWRARIGVVTLATDHTLEYDFRRLLNLPGVAFYIARLANSTRIVPETLRAMADGLTRTAELILPGMPLDMVVYGCTSGTLMIGYDRVRAAVQQARPEAVCITPITAALAGFEQLGVRRLGLIVPYVDDINQVVRQAIEQHGYQIPVMASWHLDDDNQIARTTPDSIKAAVLEVGGRDTVDAVFVSCTSLRTAECIADLESQLGKPVIASNQALAWQCLRQAGIDQPITGAGRLLTV